MRKTASEFADRLHLSADPSLLASKGEESVCCRLSHENLQRFTNGRFQ